MRRTSQSAGADGAEGTKARIQQAALELFVVHGYEKTSLREIADRLGITKAALYYHYASKQELLKSITQPLIDEFEVLVAAAPDRDTLLRSYVGVLSRHQAVFQLVANDHASLAAAELVERSARLRRDIVRQLAGPEPTPVDYVLASAAFGAMAQGFAVARRVEPQADPALPGTGAYPDGEELTELLVAAALRVLQPVPEPAENP
ncbi:MAG: TetR/AcrR family transcriptional regulator [Catenulispora sp.]|nr:TetR/AcrR family transcriptional regulator [Catenulispora sp.]